MDHPIADLLYKEQKSIIDDIANRLTTNEEFSFETGEYELISYNKLWFNVNIPNGDIARVETTKPAGLPNEIIWLEIYIFRPIRDRLGNFLDSHCSEPQKFQPRIGPSQTVLWDGTQGRSLTSTEVVDLFIKELRSHMHSSR